MPWPRRPNRKPLWVWVFRLFRGQAHAPRLGLKFGALALQGRIRFWRWSPETCVPAPTCSRRPTQPEWESVGLPAKLSAARPAWKDCPYTQPQASQTLQYSDSSTSPPYSASSHTCSPNLYTKPEPQRPKAPNSSFCCEAAPALPGMTPKNPVASLAALAVWSRVSDWVRDSGCRLGVLNPQPGPQ